MKKIFAVILVFCFFMFSGLSYAGEAVHDDGPNSLPGGRNVVGEPVPGATLRKDIKDAVEEGNKGLVKALKNTAGTASNAQKTAEEAGKKAASALELGNSTKKIVDETVVEMGKNISDVNASLTAIKKSAGDANINIIETAKITVENGKAINWLGWCLGVIIVAGFVVVIFLLRNGQNAVASDIDRLSASVASIAVDVAGIPNETAKLVKQLEPEVFLFTLSDGSIWEYTTPIVSGELVSLKVLDDSVSKLIINPDEIPLYTNRSASRVKNFTGKVLEKHFVHNQFSGTDPKEVAQRDVIMYQYGNSLKRVK